MTLGNGSQQKQNKAEGKCKMQRTIVGIVLSIFWNLCADEKEISDIGCGYINRQPYFVIDKRKRG